MARVEGGGLRVLSGVARVYDLALRAIDARSSLAEVVEASLSSTLEDYDRVTAEGRLWYPLDHPDPAHVLVSGTGLTHLASATARADMHQTGQESGEPYMTDSMKLFQLGVDHGKPNDGGAGVQPEWFYKGNGRCLVRPGHALRVPEFSLDAGEEPEIVGLYVVGANGEPYRVGFALGNELSDHVTERQNYLYLAHSKLRPCSFGPELVVGALPDRISGESRVLRGDQELWKGSFRSGEAHMSHRISGLEHHHFKYELFREPGSVHVHFFGTGTLSFAAGVRTRAGDRFVIECSTFGRALENTLESASAPDSRVSAL